MLENANINRANQQYGAKLGYAISMSQSVELEIGSRYHIWKDDGIGDNYYSVWLNLNYLWK